MSLYALKAVDKIIESYVKKGGEVLQVEEGCLGYGLLILHDFREPKKLKTVIITEVYLNEWSSTHKIRMYKKCPKKYMEMIEEYERK